jgi:hypothetical protein
MRPGQGQESQKPGRKPSHSFYDRRAREFQGVKDEVDLFQVDLTVSPAGPPASANIALERRKVSRSRDHLSRIFLSGGRCKARRDWVHILPHQKPSPSLAYRSSNRPAGRKLAAVPKDEFEAALATKSVRGLIDKPTPVSDDALLFIGSMRAFERRGYLARIGRRLHGDQQSTYEHTARRSAPARRGARHSGRPRRSL